MSDIKNIEKQGVLFEAPKTTPKKEEKKKVDKKEKKASKKTATKKEEKYKFPFQFAFGPSILTAKVLEEKLSFENDKEYTAAEVKEKLSRAVMELQAPDANVLYLKEKNTFVLSNVLQKKGASKINASSLYKIQKAFVETYLLHGTEERALIYKNVHTGQERIIIPNNQKTSVSLLGSPTMYLKNDIDWPLVADLHSHHVMCGNPSNIDNDNEQVRGIIFGIAHWTTENMKKVFWRFRRWNGYDYEVVDFHKEFDISA